MFSEFLDAHPMETLLRDEPFSLFPPAEDRAAWEGSGEEDQRQIRDMSDGYACIPYPMRKATAFWDYVRTGSRQADEAPYFQRRRKLCAAVLRCCLEDGAPLDDVIDGIYCICEETVWVISAHRINPIPGAGSAAECPLPDGNNDYIDLFSAQTAMILSLTGHLLGKRLDQASPVIRERITREIRRRVLQPFLERNDCWWMGTLRRDLNNWTPWIVSNLLTCAFLSDFPCRGDRARFADKCCRILDRWLAVMPADGGCDEGAGYWNMAGGALLDCLELMEGATGGALAFWQDEKIRRILSFPLAAALGNGWFVNFADCDARPFLSGERLQLAGEKIGNEELTALGVSMRGTLAAQLDDVPHFTRVLSLLNHTAPETLPLLPPMRDTWLPDLQLRIVRKGAMTLCCKGGHNGENHNHNDVGSFMLYVNGEPEIVDAGNRVYTAATFSDQRYSLWHVRSAWHNVPLIQGMEQQPGAQYRAENVQLLEDGLSLELQSAYGQEAKLKRLERTLRLTENKLILQDRIEMEESQTVSWVFLLRNRPDVKAGEINAGSIRLSYPPEFSCEVEERPVDDPRMARNFPGSLWRAVLSAPEKTVQQVIFTVEGKA